MGTKFKLERDEQQAVLQRLIRLGHQYNPAFPELLELNEDNVKALELDHRLARMLVASYQSSFSDDFNAYAFRAHSRSGVPDGEVGPATEDMLFAPRCGEPDFYSPESEVYKDMHDPEKFGNGNWKGCHGVGEFHCCRDKMDTSRMPAHVKRNWDKIVPIVQAAYAAVGLLWQPSTDWTDYNTDMYWVGSSSGWIGLASVMNGRGCGKSGMNSYLATYGMNQNDLWIINQWAVLIMHEKGHNCGYSHTNGFIMNPSLRPGTKPTWIGDTLESSLRQKFGGVPVPIPGNPTQPPPVDPPPTGGGRVSISGNRLIVPPNATPGTFDLSIVMAGGGAPPTGGGGQNPPWQF